MKQLYEIFTSLKSCVNNAGFEVMDIPNIKHHKIGVSQNGHPLLFIKNEFSEKQMLDESLELISIQYNRECNLYSDDILLEEGRFTLIILKSDIPEIQEYFIDILYLTLYKLPQIPKLDEIRSEIATIVDLFRNFSKPSIKTIQGVWAELLVIEQSKDPDYLVNAWHSSVSSKYDFNDGVDKIEVKCTLKDRRLHRFSISQLEPNSSSNLLIASIMTSETGIGLNIFDLRERIYSSLQDKKLIRIIDSALANTLGRDIEKAGDCFFDYHSATDYLFFYDSITIPTIKKDSIPKQILNIKFDCDLTSIDHVIKLEYSSKLFASLNINT